MNPNSEKPVGAREWTLMFDDLAEYGSILTKGVYEPQENLEYVDVIEKSHADKREAELVQVLKDVVTTLKFLQNSAEFTANGLMAAYLMIKSLETVIKNHEEQK